MATQELGADGGYHTVVQAGPTELLKHFTQIRRIKNAIVVSPGLFVSMNGETNGIVDLAAAGDEDTSVIELVLNEEPVPSAIITDGTMEIDRTITGSDTSKKYVKTLKQSGGLFEVACIRADESTTEEEGQLMAMEATGHLKVWAYTDTAEATDVIYFPWLRAQAVSTDVAGTDLVITVMW